MQRESRGYRPGHKLEQSEEDSQKKDHQELTERLLEAWIGINGMLKDSRITRDLTYNEAIVMKLVYSRFQADGTGRTAVRYIREQTNMLKSQMNRTINALCDQGYLCKERDPEDLRSLFVRPVPERMPDFLSVHTQSLELAQRIIAIIGEDDAEAFVRMYGKLAAAGVRL